MPPMSGPITHTSPDTERGMVGRKQNAKNISNQARGKTNKPETHLAEESPTRKRGKNYVVEKPPPKVQENVKKTKRRMQPRSERQLSMGVPRDLATLRWTLATSLGAKPVAVLTELLYANST